MPTEGVSVMRVLYILNLSSFAYIAVSKEELTADISLPNLNVVKNIEESLALFLLVCVSNVRSFV